jgi:hypothetical protein
MVSYLDPSCFVSEWNLTYFSTLLSLQTVVDGTRHGELCSTIQVSVVQMFTCLALSCLVLLSYYLDNAVSLVNQR